LLERILVFRFLRSLLFVILCLAGLTAFLSPSLLPAHALTFSNFASVSQPGGGIALDSTKGRLIVICCYFGTQKLEQVDSSGTVTAFAPSFTGADEVYLAVSPGFGNFTGGTVFAGTGVCTLGNSCGTIAKITPDGSVVTDPWTTCTGASGAAGFGGAFRGGFTFDTAGSFGYRLLALSTNGMLFAVNSTGTCSLIANAGPALGINCNTAGSCPLAEAVAIAPSSFGPFGGQAIIAGSTGYLTAISASGVVTTKIGGFTGLSELENLNFVSSISNALFENSFSQNEVIVAMSQFTSSDVGTLIVGQDTGGAAEGGSSSILQFKFTGGTLSMTTIVSGLSQLEGATVGSWPSDFSISASSPSPVSPGSPATSTIMIAALSGFSGTVSLSDTVPSGLSCGTITPSSVTLPPSPATATVSCMSTTAGTFSVTIMGTNGTMSHSTMAQFTFVSPDFSISATSPSGTLGSSIASTSTLTATSTFSGTVSLSDTVPSGLSCGTITPSSVTLPPSPTSATLTCTSTTAGNFTVAVTATSGSLSHTAFFALSVNKASPMVTTILSTTTVLVGGTASDSGTLANSFNANGTATYQVFPSSFCSGSSSIASIVAVTNGAVPPSRHVAFNQSGTYGWIVSYGGDSDNNPARSACEPLEALSPQLFSQYWGGTFYGNPLPTGNGCTISYAAPSAPILAASVIQTDSTINSGVPTNFNWFPFSYNQFSVKWTGAISIPSTGTYAFNLTSDDGSWLYIDSAIIVNDGGIHNAHSSAATVTLASGLHTIEVDFYETCGGGSGIDLAWMPPGSSSFAIVPSTVLWHPPVSPLVTTSIMPSPTVGVSVSVTDQATLTAVFPPAGPTGSVTYSMGQACSGGGSGGGGGPTLPSPQTVTVGPSNSVPGSSWTTPSTAGSYSFNTYYSGDINNNPASSSCEPLTVVSTVVAGVVVPIDQIAVLAPFIGPASLIIAAIGIAVVYVKRSKRRNGKEASPG